MTPAGTGSVKVTVAWPSGVGPATIPPATQSIGLYFSTFGGSMNNEYCPYRGGPLMIVRPASDGTLTEMPVGKGIVWAYAFSGTTASVDTILASKAVAVDVVRGVNPTLAVVLQTSPPSYPTSTYMPLKLGSSWSYHYSDDGTDQIVLDQRGLNIQGSAGRLAFGDSSYAMAWGHGPDGLVRTSGDSDWNVSWLYLPAPVAVGTSGPGGPWWVNDIQVEYLTATIKSVTATVQVTAGTYTNCVVVDSTYQDGATTVTAVRSWFAPDVGLVKEEGVADPYTMELTAYVPGP